MLLMWPQSCGCALIVVPTDDGSGIEFEYHEPEDDPCPRICSALVAYDYVRNLDGGDGLLAALFQLASLDLDDDETVEAVDEQSYRLPALGVEAILESLDWPQGFRIDEQRFGQIWGDMPGFAGVWPCGCTMGVTLEDDLEEDEVYTTFVPDETCEPRSCTPRRWLVESR